MRSFFLTCLFPLRYSHFPVPSFPIACGGRSLSTACSPFALSYLFLLLWEILKAAIGVAGVIYRGENPGEGKLVRFSSGLRSELARTVLADSITLTPGTVTVEMRGDEFLVHCLLPSYGEGLADCSFVRRLRRLDAILMKEKEKERSV